MSRPLIQKRIDELEAMFESEHGDPGTLRLLETELAFRSVPRASSLLAKVKRALGGGVVLPSAKQDELFEHRSQTASQTPLWTSPLLDRSSAPSPTSQPKVAAAPVAKLPQMSFDEACKVLRVTAGASWEVIENARREIVERAHPAKLKALKDGQRTTLMLEANRANAAYAVLRDRSAS